MELVKINPKEFGLTDETAKNIQEQFAPMLQKMVELEAEYNTILKLPIEDPETSKKAKETRLKYVKVRTGTAEIHKQQKAFYLNGGRFVDGWKNAQLFASQGKEDELEKIEKYQEILAQQKRDKLQLERTELIRPYVEDTTALDLGSMQEDVFQAYLSAKKQAYEDKLAAEKKAEEDRIAAEKAEAEAREAQRLENLRLKAEAEAREKEIQKERDKAESERKRLAAEQAKKDAEMQAKLKAEAEAKAKLEAELKAKRDAEIKAENDRKAAEAKAKAEAEKLAKAPIKKQLTIWVDSFSIPASDLKHDKKTAIEQKFEAFKKWAKTEIESI